MKTLRQVVNLIRKHKPATPKAFAAIGVTLEKKHLGAGVFREAIKVVGYPLVVKFPLGEELDGKLSYNGGIEHTKAEVKKLTGLGQISWLKEYLPKIYYHDKKSGIVVLHWYKDFENEGRRFAALGRLLTKAINRSTGAKIGDIHSDNVRMGKTKRDIVLIDLGY